MKALTTIRRVAGFAPIPWIQLPAIEGVPPDDPSLRRVDEHIHWYDFTARLAMRRYHRTRFVQLVAGAAIPITQIVWVGVMARTSAAVLGSIVIVAQALASGWHDAEHYPSYRTTAEQLKSERFKFSVRITPYDNPPPGKTALKLLAETAESIASQERQQWTKTQQTGDTGQQPQQ